MSSILDALDVVESIGPIETDITEICGWYQTLCDRCIPRQRLHLSRKYPPWYSTTLVKWLLCKSPSKASKAKYKAAASSVKVQLIHCRKLYESQLSMQCKTNPKLLYQYLNRRRPITPAITTIEHNDTTITDPVEIANIFNNAYWHAFSTDIPLLPQNFQHEQIFHAQNHHYQWKISGTAFAISIHINPGEQMDSTHTFSNVAVTPWHPTSFTFSPHH